MFFSNHFKGRNEWYLYLLGTILVATGYLAGQVPMTLALFLQMNRHPELGSDTYALFGETLDFSLFKLSVNEGLFLALLIFVFALLGLVVAIKWLHKRDWRSLISWEERIDWSRFAWGFAIWLGISLLFEMVMYLAEPGNYTFRMPDSSFLVLILISVCLLPLQTGFEELFFRGYVMQFIGGVTGNKLFALLATGIMFALVHSMNPEVGQYGFWKMIPYYLIAGFFLAYVTIMDDRLELALGIHAATNMFGSLFVTYEGAALQTGSLFKTKEVDPLFLAGIFLFFSLLFIIWAARKYKWESPPVVFKKSIVENAV